MIIFKSALSSTQNIIDLIEDVNYLREIEDLEELEQKDISETDDGCKTFIEDDGIGIPDDEKEKIFEKGYKKGEQAGSGLGLHLAKTIAESYGGNIDIEDSELGGAKFIISLKKSQ